MPAPHRPQAHVPQPRPGAAWGAGRSATPRTQLQEGVPRAGFSQGPRKGHFPPLVQPPLATPAGAAADILASDPLPTQGPEAAGWGRHPDGQGPGPARGLGCVAATGCPGLRSGRPPTRALGHRLCHMKGPWLCQCSSCLPSVISCCPGMDVTLSFLGSTPGSWGLDLETRKGAWRAPALLCPGHLVPPASPAAACCLAPPMWGPRRSAAATVSEIPHDELTLSPLRPWRVEQKAAERLGNGSPQRGPRSRRPRFSPSCSTQGLRTRTHTSHGQVRQGPLRLHSPKCQ